MNHDLRRHRDVDSFHASNYRCPLPYLHRKYSSCISNLVILAEFEYPYWFLARYDNKNKHISRAVNIKVTHNVGNYYGHIVRPNFY